MKNKEITTKKKVEVDVFLRFSMNLTAMADEPNMANFIERNRQRKEIFSG
jgi:hypothetical protein